MSYAHSTAASSPARLRAAKARPASHAAPFNSESANLRVAADHQAPSDPLAEFLTRIHFPGWQYGAVEVDASPVRVSEPNAAWFYLGAAGEALIEVDGASAPLTLRSGDSAIVISRAGRQFRVGVPSQSISSPQTTLLYGKFAVGVGGTHSLERLLPSATALIVKNEDSLTATGVVDWLKRTLAAPAPGADAVAGKLLQTLLLETLRIHLLTATDEATGPLPQSTGPLQAALDPCLGAVLRLVHAKPERDWTVHSMARESGLSRSAFADRFRTIVGQPPLQYVTEIRMQKASELLETTNIPVKRIAALVGYESVSAFSSAFKRRFGTPPIAVRPKGAGAPAMQR